MYKILFFSDVQQFTKYTISACNDLTKIIQDTFDIQFLGLEYAITETSLKLNDIKVF